MSGSLFANGNQGQQGYGNVGLSTNAGTALMTLLLAEDLEPGSTASYELCKNIFLYHPLGQRMTGGPISLAQSQERKLSIPGAPEDRVRAAFQAKWRELNINHHILSLGRNARIYGQACVVVGINDVLPSVPLDYASIAKNDIYFNDLDPLNTSGAFSMNQTPNNPNFLSFNTIDVQGTRYHPSRGLMLLNEEPIYLAYSTSAFGFSGRSVYQRALYPLKSFVQSMITDDMVTQKAGLLVAKMEQQGSIMDNLMAGFAAIKRKMLQVTTTGNVLSIGPNDSIESIDLKNIDGALITARKNVIENVSTACDMPAKLLNSQSYALGFGEGTEDAKAVAQFVSWIREWLNPAYIYFDQIVMAKSWTPEFYQTIQRDFPEYADVSFQEAFYQWKNTFKAEWPSPLMEPESEAVKISEVKLKGLISIAEVMIPAVDPENRAKVMEWIADNVNEDKFMFPNPLILDIEALEEYQPPQENLGRMKENKVPRPSAGTRIAS